MAVMVPAPGAFAARDPLAEAQGRITAAQEASNRATSAYDAAQTHYYQLQDDISAARQTVARLRAQRDGLVASVQSRASALYMRAGSVGLDMLQTSGDVLDGARRTTLAAAANAGNDQTIGRLGAVTEDLGVREASLRSDLKHSKRALDDLRAQQDQLQRALGDARQAEQDLRARLESERRASEYAALVRQARDSARSSGSSSGGSSSSGGRSSSGGGAGQIIGGGGTWVCPVQGSLSFTDTFGAPRGGGRTHKGIDIFAASGTPTVAVVSGSVFFQSDTLGGLAAYVTGGDGTTYYYAHLSDYVGGGRSVSAGELIGHVGNTGDASDAPPQLHFEIRPGGPNGTAIDPYPTVAAHC
jgi:septal ring factor EnvC (AmiA/AmiB activator)